MRLFYLLLPLLFLPALSPLANGQAKHIHARPMAPADPFPAHIDTAVSYFGPKEPRRENHGPDIKKFLTAVGLPQGNPYCAAFVSFVLDAPGNVSYPTVRSGLAQAFITDRSIDAKSVLRGQVSIPSGAVFIMKRGDTIHGHVGFVLLAWHGRTGITISGNTSFSGHITDPRKDQGVWIRQRQVYSSCYFCIKKFTPVTYK